ncbi:alpha/beta hydrolase [Mycobacterium heckeshornense]|uniref:Putative hydrolase, alpha/beta hydrolase fold protein n=1 Tax=Mycobacterium heckeshornense TaxID=110505 RepID=A0A2G8B4S3_9MYCO|nr:alpha/beta hydrolase [Mycobacterium heckeshornense]KMV24189.1 hydrolase [Mycobacterium heckeshornense]MCV7036414.1 alpha/beta hydrolase [Mycobacterium heckeshornense]PIJ32753.1 alpha/beta hydrolase [Mycobacterium heckeshornense]BCO34274.1 putative hydrolase, alpha/beta hydrolase fold protein [Mycobacterium heckeshornense]
MAETVVVEGAEIEYNDTGSGPPLVFVHGVYVTGALWDDVTRRLSDRYRCIAPTWPFGAQRTPVGPHADLGVRAAGWRISGLLEALDLSDVTLVANDTGGGIVQAALGDGGLDFGRVARLVFTNCDSFEHFPPSGFAPLVRLCRLSATLGMVVLRLLATGPGLARFASTVTRRGIDRARWPALFGGFANSAAVRREAVRLTADLDPSYTLAATAAMKAWDKPVLILWGDSDRLFPMTHARRLAETFPHAQLRTINNSSTYVMLDEPNETASAISEFVAGVVR